MKQTIINSFIDKSVKAPSYEPNELTRKNFGDWITANPLGTYKEWKEYLRSRGYQFYVECFRTGRLAKSNPILYSRAVKITIKLSYTFTKT